MILPHAPYQRIVDTMFDDISNQQQLCKELELRKSDVQTLRRSFNQDQPETDYSRKSVCDAYMLMYYPYYIETIHRVFHIVDSLTPSTFGTFFGEKTNMTVSFLGTGPSPELLGIISYVAEHQPNVKELQAHLVDMNTASWSEYRRKYTLPMATMYGDIRINPKEYTCNLLTCGTCSSLGCSDYLYASDIVVMQNCITDLVTARNKHADIAGFSFLDIFMKLRSGAIISLIDLDYGGTWDAINEAVTAVQSSELGTVLCRSQACEEYDPIIDRPECLNFLFDGSPGLMMRKHTRFHYAVIQKVDNDSRHEEMQEDVDWIRVTINQQLNPLGFSVVSRQEHPYRLRYNITAKGENSGNHGSIDVIFNKKGKITKIQLQGKCLDLGDLECLIKQLTGEGLTQQTDKESPKAATSFKNEMLETEHNKLVEQLASIGIRVREIRQLQYTVRYKVENRDGKGIVFDQYYNGRNQYTKTALHLQSCDSDVSWEPLKKLLKVSA